MADGIKAARGVSSHNNTSSGHNRQSGDRTDVLALGGGAEIGQSGGRQPSAVDASFSLSRKAATEQELQSFLNMLEETNRKIKEDSNLSAERGEEMRIVPSVLGLPISSAVVKLKGSGLKVSRISRQFNPGVPDGNVITQVPGPGSTARPGNGVHIIVSSGPRA